QPLKFGCSVVQKMFDVGIFFTRKGRQELFQPLVFLQFTHQVFERDKHCLNSRRLLSLSCAVYEWSEKGFFVASFAITSISFLVDSGSVISIFRSNILVAINRPSFPFL